VAADPKDRDLKMMLAGELADQGHPDEGVAMAKSLLEGATPEEQRGVWLAIGQINVRLHRWKDAEDAIDKSEPLATKKEDRTYLFFMRGELAERRNTTIRPSNLSTRRSRLILRMPIRSLSGLHVGRQGEKLPEALKMIARPWTLSR